VLFYGVGIIQQMVLFITQRTRAVGLILAGSAAMNLGLNVALAPRLGGTGAALATLITYALMAGATFFASRDVLLVRLGLGHATRCLAAGLAAGTTFALLDPRTIAGIVLTSLASLAVYALALLATGAVRPAEIRNAVAVVRGRSDARTSPPSR
jgi:O-antigen/teichoic acid export membrane protein